MLGTLQYGYLMGSWNTAWIPWAITQKILTVEPGKWVGDYVTVTDADGSNRLWYLQFVQGVSMLGATLGAMFSANIAFLGRYKVMLLSNALIIIGSLLCLIFYNFLPVLLIGRLIQGLAAGSFTVFCPLYINETSPSDLKGPAGAMFQVIVAFGIFLGMAVISVSPEGEELVDAENDHFNSHAVLFVIFGSPILFSLLQLLLLLSIYKFDTPVFLIQKGKGAEAREYYARLYRDCAVDSQFISDII